MPEPRDPLQQSLLWELKSMAKHLVENGLKGACKQGFLCEKAEFVPKYPWGRLDYMCNSKTNKSVSVSVICWKLIWKQFKRVSVMSGVQV